MLQDVALGSFLAAGSDVVADVMAGAGLDWLLVDLEHGAGDEAALARQLPVVRGAGVACLVRVESGERIRIGRALDLGADGIMVPRVETRAAAEAIVGAARYTPAGSRGVAVSTRAARYGRTTVPMLADIEQPLVIVQIESPDAVASSDQIASLDGVDCLFVGPADLSSALGIPGDLSHQRVQDSLARVLDATNNHGKAAGIMAGSPEDVHRFVAMGFRLISLASDLSILAKTMHSLVGAARQFETIKP